jgi:CheY-like chemotaxis protein/DNA-binding MarR family transcriptional regulator
MALLEELAEGLRLEGLPVATCTSGWQALQLITAQPDIRILVTDLAMPEMGGIELLRRLATRKVSPGVKAIVLTGEATLDGAIDAMRLQVSEFLYKPVTADELASAVRRAAGTCEASVDPSSAEAATGADPFASRLGALVGLYEDRNATFGVELFHNLRWDLLLRLAASPEAGAVTLNDLALLFRQTPRAVRRCLRDLTAAGLVEEAPAVDRRRRAFRLTAEGRRQTTAFLARLAAR